MDYTSALISATVSLVVFTATQWWGFYKSYHDQQRSKLEEMLIGYRHLLTKLKRPEMADEPKTEAMSCYFDLYEALNQPDLITKVYFPTLNHERGKIHELVMMLLAYYLQVARDPESIWLNDLTTIPFEISDKVVALEEICHRQYAELTCAPSYYLIKLLC